MSIQIICVFVQCASLLTKGTGSSISFIYKKISLSMHWQVPINDKGTGTVQTLTYCI